MTQTNRGFNHCAFKDASGEICSIQESSSVEPRIWLGVDKPKLVVYQDKSMGKYLEVDMPDQFSVHSRMELTQRQAADLLPFLLKFVKTGYLK